MTISLLIPVHDYDIITFVRSMRTAIDSVPELMEIVIGDDGSSTEYYNKFKQLEDEYIKVIRSEKNIGRAAIRNKLIDKSKGDYLLFIDQDAMFPSTAEAYIRNWVNLIGESKVIYGGIQYQQGVPTNPDKMLRWKYGRAKEQVPANVRLKHPHRSFSTFNVMFHRSVFEKLRFNEELKEYGYEDTLLAFQLKVAGVDIYHVDNALYHEGLETNQEFIDKMKHGVSNLNKMYDSITNQKEFAQTVELISIYNVLRLFGIHRLLRTYHEWNKEKIEIKLNKSNPSLKLFTFYRMCIFCKYRLSSDNK